MKVMDRKMVERWTVNNRTIGEKSLYMDRMVCHKVEGSIMGISMAICELDTEVSLCKKGKTNILKARLEDIQGWEASAEYDLIVDSSDAKKVMGSDWEAFLKRNRLDGEQEKYYLDKIKKDEDIKKLQPVAKKTYTGWVVLEKLPAEKREEALKKAGPDNLLTGWDCISFDEMNATCGKCGMSWDKGRGCIGTFGPDNTQLPEIARKYDCKIVGSVPESAKERKRMGPEEAKILAKECVVLKEKLPLEGKNMVRRYSGVVERLEVLAELCDKNQVRFYFF